MPGPDPPAQPGPPGARPGGCDPSPGSLLVALATIHPLPAKPCPSRKHPTWTRERGSGACLAARATRPLPRPERRRFFPSASHLPSLAGSARPSSLAGRLPTEAASRNNSTWAYGWGFLTDWLRGGQRYPPSTIALQALIRPHAKLGPFAVLPTSPEAALHRQSRLLFRGGGLLGLCDCWTKGKSAECQCYLCAVHLRTSR